MESAREAGRHARISIKLKSPARVDLATKRTLRAKMEARRRPRQGWTHAGTRRRRRALSRECAGEVWQLARKQTWQSQQNLIPETVAHQPFPK